MVSRARVEAFLDEGVEQIDPKEMRAGYIIEQLELGTLRSDLINYRNVRRLLNEKDPKKRLDGLRQEGLPPTATNADVLKKYQLPLKAHQQDPAQADSAYGFAYWAERIRAEIPQDEQHRKVQELFDDEVTKATYSLAHGTTQGCPKSGGPNPNDRWRKLLWSSAIRFSLNPSEAEIAERTASYTTASNNASQHPRFFGEIANSVAMELYRQSFVARSNSANKGLQGRNPNVRFGEPGSWFYHAKKELNNLTQDIINLDLEVCLALNDYVDPIFQHELAHHEHSLTYPDCVEGPRKEADAAKKALQDLAKKGQGIKVSTKAVDFNPEYERLLRAYLEANYKHGLIHRVWNAIEDNMCNQNGTNLVYEKNPPYMYRLDHSMNVAKTLIAGPGSYIRGLASVEKKKRPENNAEADQATLPKGVWEKRLNDIGHAMDMAYFVRHGLAENTPQGWKEIGVDIRAIKDSSDKKGQSHDAAYLKMQALCEAIAKEQPNPNQRIEEGFDKKCVAHCNARNDKIEALIKRFVQDTLDKAMEAFRNSDLNEQIEQLKDLLEAIRRGENKGGGAGEGGIPIEIDGIEMDVPSGVDDNPGAPGQHLPKKIPEQGLDIGKPWEDTTREAAIGNTNNPDAGKNAKPKLPPMQMPAGGIPGNNQSGRPGTGTPPLDAIDLGDGRTLEKLRNDPDGTWIAARDHITEELLKIKKLFPSTTIGLEKNPTGTPFDGDFRIDRVSRPDHRDIARRQAMGKPVLPEDHRYVKKPKSVPIETPGDLFLMIDCSGSMGTGPGSRLAIALKSAALLYDAAQEAGFGVYISLWGNQHPTLIAAPESKKDDVFSRLDTPLRAVLQNSNVPGLHGGTNLEGVMAGMFAQLAIPRDDLKHKSQRGSVYGLLLSDCEVGKQCERLHEALNTHVIPGLSLDVGSTATKSNDVADIMKQVNQAGSFVQVDLETASRIPHELLHWATTRYDKTKDQISAHQGKSTAWNLTQEMLQQQAKAALDIFCDQKEHSSIRSGETQTTIDEVERVAKTQRAQVISGERGTAGTGDRFTARLASELEAPMLRKGATR